MIMRFVALAFLVSACAAVPAASAQKPLWDGRGSPEGRAAIRACLDRQRMEGGLERCRAAGSIAPSPDEIGAAARQRNWAVIDNWEKEMDVTLAWLRENGPREDVDASQHAWEASMLADVSVFMNMYDGGSLAGVVGSEVRADAVITRVLFLEKLRQQIEAE
jgi:hypothetical protein